MPIYKYSPTVVPGPNGHVVSHSDPDGVSVYVGAIDGQVFVRFPEGAALPKQPVGIELTPITEEEVETLRGALPTFRTTRNLAEAIIAEEVGDTASLLADLSKRVGMLERLVMRMSIPVLQNQPVPQEISDAYLPYVQEYIAAIDVDGVRDRVDLESLSRIFQTVMSRSARIAEIVDDVHLKQVRDMLEG